MSRILCVYTKGAEYGEAQRDFLLRQRKDIECLELRHDWQGWWSKMELFRPDVKGDILYFDLDTVITGDVDKYRNLDKSYVLRDFYKPDTMIGSGMMFLKENDRKGIWGHWIADPDKHMREYRGDQEYLKQHLWGAGRWQDDFDGEIISYKAHLCPDNKFYTAGYSLEKANVVCFHGQPRPWNVKL